MERNRISPRSPESNTPRRRNILVENLVAAVQLHFSPRPVEIEFAQSGGGINYIRVLNDDKTFDFYIYNSQPTYVDLINQVFASSDRPTIKAIEQMFGQHVVSAREQREKLHEVRKKYELPAESNLEDWESATDESRGREAWEEWTAWYAGKQVLVFVYEDEENQ